MKIQTNACDNAAADFSLCFVTKAEEKNSNVPFKIELLNNHEFLKKCKKKLIKYPVFCS